MLSFYTYDRMLKVVDEAAKRIARRSAAGHKIFYPARPGLGWEIEPLSYHRGDLCSSDASGFRPTSDRDDFADALPRVSVWGDSLVQGGEVEDADSWPWLLQEKLATTCRVLNGGVSAYGTDQALLRMKARFDEVESEVVILSYATSDLLRNVNVLRCFLHRSADFVVLKPRFKLLHDGIEAVEPPFFEHEEAPVYLRKPEVRAFLAENDLLYPQLGPQALEKLLKLFGASGLVDTRSSVRRQALQITKRIFEDFFVFCAQRRITGIALLLPMFQGRYASGEDFDELVAFFRHRGFRFMDLRPNLVPAGRATCSDYFTPRNHYTRRAGEIIAEHVAQTVHVVLK